ncbi:MAG: TraA family conjugative transfer protein [Gammaproteobacteria bacterium]
MNKLKRQQLFVVLLAFTMLLCTEAAWAAGGGGAEFATAYNQVTGWMTGGLGKLITAALLITGIGMGIVRQSVIAAVPAIAAGLVLTLGPGVIDAIFGAVI